MALRLLQHPLPCLGKQDRPAGRRLLQQAVGQSPASTSAAPSRSLQRHGPGAIIQRTRRNRFVDESDPLRLAGVDRPARQNEPERFLQPDQAGQAGRAAESGNDAEPDLGQPDPCLGSIAREPVAARQDHLGPATQAGAVDGGDGGHGQQLEPPEDALTFAARCRAALRVGDICDLADVCAGHEGPRLAAADDDGPDPARVHTRLHLAEQSVEAEQNVGRQQVYAAVGSVENEPGDAVALDIQRQRRPVVHFTFAHACALLARRIRTWVASPPCCR